MAKIRSYTTIEQSKKLAEILPLESSDCFWDYDGLQKFHRISWFEEGYNKESQLRLDENNVCAWSLAALLEEIPSIIVNNVGEDLKLHIEKDNLQYYLFYENEYTGDMFEIETELYDDMIDAAFEMIIELHELNLL